MNRPSNDEDLPFYDPDDHASYSLDIVARITGISSQTILHYQEEGLIRQQEYDDETLRTLRRIEHLQDNFGVNEAGLRLILGLIDELERLRLHR